MNNWHILTECYIDTLLAEVVSPPKNYNHKHSCTKVLITMKSRLLNNAAFGIIDDDKVKPKDLEEFAVLKKHNEQLSIYKHKNKPHYIVKLGKAAEDFILQNAKKCNVELENYDLPSDLNGLMKITKHFKSLQEAENQLKKLFYDLKQNQNSDFYQLSQWLENFKENPYSFIK